MAKGIFILKHQGSDSLRHLILLSVYFGYGVCVNILKIYKSGNLHRFFSPAKRRKSRSRHAERGAFSSASFWAQSKSEHREDQMLHSSIWNLGGKSSTPLCSAQDDTARHPRLWQKETRRVFSWAPPTPAKETFREKFLYNLPKLSATMHAKIYFKFIFKSPWFYF